MFYPNVTLEAIAHQFDRKFILDLNTACEDLKIAYERVGSPTSSKDFHLLKKELIAISEVIRHRTNVSLDMGIYASGDNNAYVDIGPLGINHPFFKWAHDHFSIQQSDLDARGYITKIINSTSEAIGWVDRLNAKVHGILTTIDFESKISWGLIKFGRAAGIAATILHELGHAFTLLEYLTGVLTRNYQLGSIAQAIMKQTDRDSKLLIIDVVRAELTDKKNYPHLDNREYQAATGRKFTVSGDILDAQVILDAKSQEELTLYLINAGVKPYYSDNGNYYYDTSGAEFLADQFATRLGAGLDLVIDLHAIYANNPERSLVSRCMLITLELLAFVIPWIAVIILVSVALTPYPIKQYDDPKDRIIRIRNEMVDALKDPDLEPKHKKRYIDDIERCNVLLREYNRYFSIIGFVVRMVFPSKRKQHNDMLLQKKLEALANNNLFTSAAKFELID